MVAAGLAQMGQELRRRHLCRSRHCPTTGRGPRRVEILERQERIVGHADLVALIEEGRAALESGATSRALARSHPKGRIIIAEMRDGADCRGCREDGVPAAGPRRGRAGHRSQAGASVGPPAVAVEPDHVEEWKIMSSSPRATSTKERRLGVGRQRPRRRSSRRRARAPAPHLLQIGVDMRPGWHERIPGREARPRSSPGKP